MTRERDRIQENANKYIVKNCPAFIPQAYEHCCSLDGNYKCEGCTDCVIKQVIEKCREQSYFVKRFPMLEHSDGVINSKLAFDILQLLDIQEVK